MSLIGVSTLELRQMIEQACLPDRCEISCADGAHLTIRLGNGQDLTQAVTLCDVPLSSLNSSRDLVNLVGQLHAMRDGAPVYWKKLA
ncbi:DUF1652 domain-containing protein [Pseudomonas sp. DE0157]|uniref:DUF1652 domain-containing protein n=1 Tax=Pseudomonas sp. DE0157 TaxID=2584952 RepID=UPI0011A4161D|nr:DUF1652 domain-containing protein [Pseudomonas sp. DE0157]